MFGFDPSFLVDWAPWGAAIAVTVYVFVAGNPHAVGTDEYQGIRLCRIGLALLVWSIVLGLTGLISISLALITFILAIIGTYKGCVGYGLFLIVGSVCVLLISFAYSTVAQFLK
jgi:hypothetical protein